MGPRVHSDNYDLLEIVLYALTVTEWVLKIVWNIIIMTEYIGTLLKMKHDAGIKDYLCL